MTGSTAPTRLLGLTADIVAAHLGHNRLMASAVPELIETVYRSLATVETTAETAAPAKPEPAVPVKRSVFPDHIVCLEDGAKLKMMKRYLASRYQMTPEQYRQRWNLPPEYPMVAPNYAARRSALAKSIGLGRGGRQSRRDTGREADPDARASHLRQPAPSRQAVIGGMAGRSD